MVVAATSDSADITTPMTTGGASTTGQVIMVDGGYNIMGMPRVENL